jgi:hypothetical protein
MISIRKYQPEDRHVWDEFIRNSKNGVFFHLRDYMEYHSDRFEDFSLIFHENNKIIAVMPGNIDDDILYSHGGLTFGGIISNKKMKTIGMLGIFDSLKEYLTKHGIKKVYYKAIPPIYHDTPAEEDLYALSYNNAKLVRRDVSSAIYLKSKLNISKNKLRNAKNCKKAGIELKKSNDYVTYMNFKEESLKKKYGVTPVHSGDEMQLLAERFPENIKLFNAEKDGEFYAGIIIYESKNVAHAQYMASTDEGLKIGAPNFVFDYLIRDYYQNKKYFDFGISTEKNGRYLNEGLIESKERFGARAIVHDFYELYI